MQSEYNASNILFSYLKALKPKYAQNPYSYLIFCIQIVIRRLRVFKNDLMMVYYLWKLHSILGFIKFDLFL